MDLSKILNVLYRYLWLLVLAAFVAGMITFFQVNSQPVVYRTSTDLLVGPSLDSPSPDLNSLKIGGQLVQTYVEVADTPSFFEAVNNKLDHKMDLNVLKDAISTRVGTETRVLTINVRDEDPKQAFCCASSRPSPTCSLIVAACGPGSGPPATSASRRVSGSGALAS